MRKGRNNLTVLAAPLALLMLAACSGDAEGPMAEGSYDESAPSLEEVSRQSELANENDSTPEPVANEMAAE